MSVRGELVKILVFAVVTAVLTMLLASAIGNLSFIKREQYRAVFSDVAGLLPADEIRIAGVRVGQVSDIRIIDRSLAQVTFELDSDVPLTSTNQAAIRYRNLVGQRYVAIEQGPSGPGQKLERNGVIPLQQTRAALDLTALFNGFKPLFQALNPQDVNQLSFEIVKVFQGEGGTVQSLLARTASLTSTLADRDQLIGDVIDNLNETLGYLNARDDQLDNLIVTLQQTLTGFANDREAILGSLAGVNELTASTASLLVDIRPPLKNDIAALGDLATNLNRNTAFLDELLQRLPNKVNRINRTATYGGYFNFYLCQFDLTVGGVKVPTVRDDAARCTP